MIVLCGEYEVTLDEKNRILIPSEIRKLFKADDGNALVLVMGINRVPWMYPERYYHSLASQAPAQLIPDPDQHAFDQATFAMATRLEWDGQGRVLIPDRTMRRVKLQKSLAMIGVRDHLELWPRDAWEERYRHLDEARTEIARLAKRASQPVTIAIQGVTATQAGNT